MSSSKENTIKRSGDMLLGGWKMLNMTCPICNTAIMSKAGRMHCPGCDVPVMTQAEAELLACEKKLSARNPADNNPPVAGQQSQLAEVDEYATDDKGPFKSLEEEKKKYDLQRKKTDLISAKIGEYLLLGYTLLGAECPRSSCERIPLMQKVGEKPYCVSCEKYFEYDSYGAFIPVPQSVGSDSALSLTERLAATRQKEEQAAASITVASLSRREESEPIEDIFPNPPREKPQGPDPSELIGQKLLQGWALLDQTCPSARCNNCIPLMHDMQKKLYCVLCGYADQNDKIKPPVAQAPPATSKPTEVLTIEDIDLNDDALDESIVEAYNKQRMAQLHQLKSASLADSGAERANGHVVSKLIKKLQWAASELEACENIEQCLLLAELVTKLGTAISSTKKNGIVF